MREEVSDPTLTRRTVTLCIQDQSVDAVSPPVPNVHIHKDVIAAKTSMWLHVKRETWKGVQRSRLVHVPVTFGQYHGVYLSGRQTECLTMNISVVVLNKLKLS